MRVNYAMNGQARGFEITEEDDLREMARQVEEGLRARHRGLDPRQLPSQVADGILNSLCDDCEEIDLGELAVHP